MLETSFSRDDTWIIIVLICLSFFAGAAIGTAVATAVKATVVMEKPQPNTCETGAGLL